MLTVWKYPVSVDKFTVEMPKGARILTVQIQGILPVMWAVVESGNELERRMFEATRTGVTLGFQFLDYQPGIDANYIGTFQAMDIVFHLFELFGEE